MKRVEQWNREMSTVNNWTNYGKEIYGEMWNYVNGRYKRLTGGINESNQ